MDALHKLAKEIDSQLHPIELTDGGTRIVWRDSASEELREWFSDMSGNYTDHTFSQLDEVYEVMGILANLIDEAFTYKDADEVIDIYELQNLIENKDWSYTYNHELLEWAGNNTQWVDDAIENGAKSLIGAIQDAMNDSRMQMSEAFLDAMNKKGVN